MKRRIFVQKHPTIPTQSGSLIPIRANSLSVPDLIIPGDGKVHLYSFPLTLKALETEEYHLIFRLNSSLIDKSVLLLGAYQDGETVRVGLINFGQDVRLKEKQTIAEAMFVETVNFFQADLNRMETGVMNMTPVAPAPTKKPTKGRSRR